MLYNHKESKIKEITKLDEQFKGNFVFEIELENGEIGKLYKKTDNPFFAVGQLVEYTITSGGTLKVASYIDNSGEKRDNTYKGGGAQSNAQPNAQTSQQAPTRSTNEFNTDELIVRQNVLARADEIHGVMTENKIEFSEFQMLGLANRLEKWVFEKTTRDEKIVRQNVLARATTHYIRKYKLGVVINTDELLQMAERLEKWVLNKEIVEQDLPF